MRSSHLTRITDHPSASNIMTSAATPSKNAEISGRKGPFIVVALAWAVVGSLISLRSDAPDQSALKWMLGLWGLCIFDLVALAKTIAIVMTLMSSTAPEKQSALVIQALFWGVLKVGGLGLIGLALYFGDQAPGVSLALGLGTLIIVPLIGGYWSSRKDQEE